MKIRKYLETSKMEIAYENLWNVEKADKEKFIVINVYIKKTERFQLNNLTLHLEELKKEHATPKFSRRKKITNIKTKINEIEAIKE